MSQFYIHQCILGKFLDATFSRTGILPPMLHLLSFTNACTGKSCDGKQNSKKDKKKDRPCVKWTTMTLAPHHPPWQGFDQSIGIKGRPIKRAKELIFDQIGFEARYISSSCKRVACQEVTPCGYIKGLWRVEMVKYLNVIKMLWNYGWLVYIWVPHLLLQSPVCCMRVVTPGAWDYKTRVGGEFYNGINPEQRKGKRFDKQREPHQS